MRGEIHTTWLDELLQRQPHANAVEEGSEDAAAIGAAVWHAMQTANANSAQASASRGTSSFAMETRWPRPPTGPPAMKFEVQLTCPSGIKNAHRRTRTRRRPLASHSGWRSGAGRCRRDRSQHSFHPASRANPTKFASRASPTENLISRPAFANSAPRSATRARGAAATPATSKWRDASR